MVKVNTRLPLRLIRWNENGHDLVVDGPAWKTTQVKRRSSLNRTVELTLEDCPGLVPVKRVLRRVPTPELIAALTPLLE